MADKHETIFKCECDCPGLITNIPSGIEDNEDTPIKQTKCQDCLGIYKKKKKIKRNINEVTLEIIPDDVVEIIP